MVELNSIPNVPLKIIFAIHFVLITWAIQGVWSPDSYLFYNFFFLLTLIWGIHLKEKEEPLQIAILINTISVLFDILTISLFYHYIDGFGDRFSVFMAILNLVFRPISIMLLGKICAERMGVSGGEFPARFGSIFGVDVAAPAFPGQRTSYEDIDGPPLPRSYHQQQQQQPPQNPPNQSVPESAYLSL